LIFNSFDIPFAQFPKEKFLFPGHNFQFSSFFSGRNIFKPSSRHHVAQPIFLIKIPLAHSLNDSLSSLCDLLKNMQLACERMETSKHCLGRFMTVKTCYAENSSQNVKQLNPFRFIFDSSLSIVLALAFQFSSTNQ
jgi:hypothetical protein